MGSFYKKLCLVNLQHELSQYGDLCLSRGNSFSKSSMIISLNSFNISWFSIGRSTIHVFIRTTLGLLIKQKLTSSSYICCKNSFPLRKNYFELLFPIILSLFNGRSVWCTPSFSKMWWLFLSSCISFLSNWHGLPNRMWHKFIGITSHNTLSL